MVEAIQHCLANIRNTNTFMLMTINRCIDYTKVTKGLKLLPHIETTDWMETIQLPLQCMRNIQSKITIAVAPHVGKPICSHLVTDRLWLQENLLCLLSNAVKYSTDGEVTIRFHIKRLDHLDDWDNEDEEDDSDDDEEARLLVRAHRPGASSLNPSSPRRQIPDSDEPAMISFTSTGKPNMASLVRSMSQKSTASSVNDNPNRKMLVVEVEDTGIGMTDEAMKILFNPFNQTQRLAGGTGLGLFSLAKRVEALHGKYGVRRRRDGRQGSLFWFAVPYRPDHFMAEVYATNNAATSPKAAISIVPSDKKAETRNPSPPSFNRASAPTVADVTEAPLPCTLSPDVVTVEQSAALLHRANLPKLNIDTSQPPSLSNHGMLSPRIALSPRSSGPNLRVLVVDDSPAILKMAGLMLKKLGHTVSTAENGQIAVNMVRDTIGDIESGEMKQRYDIIVMDLQMPVMDGLEAISRIRAAEDELLPDNVNNKLIRHWIIGCSANSDMETQEAAINAGASMFMSKPYNVTSFCSAIAESQI